MNRRRFLGVTALFATFLGPSAALATVRPRNTTSQGIQDAIDKVRDLGGGRVILPEEDITADFIVRDTVEVVGSGPVLGGWAADLRRGTRITTGGIQLCENSWEGAGLKNLIISGATYPQTASQAQGWAGSAVTGIGYGNSIHNCMISGFDTAVDNTGGRLDMNRVFIDCNHGVKQRDSQDVDHIERVHLWPFLSPSVAEDTIRYGKGFYFENCNSWSRLMNCFSFNHTTNFHLNTCVNFELMGCGSDGYDYNAGVLIDGDSWNTAINGGNIGGVYDDGVIIDITGQLNNASVNINGLTANGYSAINQIRVKRAKAVNITGAKLGGGQYGINNQSGITVNMTGGSIVDAQTRTSGSVQLIGVM